MNKRKTLILFDIDGTLTNRVGDLKDSLWRYPYAAKKLFNVDLDLTVDDYMSYNGWVDKAQFWDQLKGTGVTRENFLKKFPLYGKYAVEYFNKRKPAYETTEGSKKLLEVLFRQKDIYLGVITGNAELLAWWKLEAAGLKKFFSFGLFGDEADSRSKLAELVFDKAKKHFRFNFEPKQIVMVGDTIYDVACAKHIGAKVILVLTGGKNSKVPKDQKPDFVVQTLADKRVRDFLEI